jgi:hypothetical protein
MKMKLSLDSLTVESFTTQKGGVFASAAAISKNYSECDTCGIACTYDCPVLSKNYSECDSCGIACTAIDCPAPSANYTDCGSCGIACTAVEPC